MRARIVWLKFHCSSVMGQGCIDLTFFEQQIREICVSVDKIGRELQGAPIIGDRLRRLTGLGKRVCQTVIGFGIIRIRFQD